MVTFHFNFFLVFFVLFVADLECLSLCFVALLCLTDKKFWFSGDPTKPEKYGYRKGSEEEAKDGKLKQTMNRVVSNVTEGTSSGTVSKGLKNEFKLATEAAKGNAGKAEFFEKQLHLEKAAREKQQQDIHKQQQELEEMKQAMDELKKGNAAAFPSQVCFTLFFFFFSTLFTQLTSLFSSPLLFFLFFLSCL